MASLRNDAEVRQDVLEALTRDARVDARQIAVEVAGQVVTLRGSVGSNYAKRAATDLARQIKGVRDVRNELGVTNPEPPPSRADAEIAREVQADLARHLRGQHRIQVDVRGGTVYLVGAVASLDQKWLAEEVAWWTAGVRDVVNELQVISSND